MCRVELVKHEGHDAFHEKGEQTRCCRREDDDDPDVAGPFPQVTAIVVVESLRGPLGWIYDLVRGVGMVSVGSLGRQFVVALCGIVVCGGRHILLGATVRRNQHAEGEREMMNSRKER